MLAFWALEQPNHPQSFALCMHSNPAEVFAALLAAWLLLYLLYPCMARARKEAKEARPTGPSAGRWATQGFWPNRLDFLLQVEISHMVLL